MSAIPGHVFFEIILGWMGFLFILEVLNQELTLQEPRNEGKSPLQANLNFNRLVCIFLLAVLIFNPFYNQ